MYAHYFKQGKKHLLTVSETMQPVGKTREVSGKKEARQICKTENLTAWNF